jgi:hypothetical protein
MAAVEDRIERSIMFLVPAIIVTLGCGASLLPREMVVRAISALMAWLALSLGIGVVVGHCALSEADGT